MGGMISQRRPRIRTLGWALVAAALACCATLRAYAATNSPGGAGEFLERESGSAALTGAPTRSPIPTSQTPTNATNNEPLLIVVLVVVALLLIAAGVVVARSRLTDDE